MAMRQYIGARYVLKVYENSLNPASSDWEAGVTYEPLTMVTYLNSSYLSKKEVPGSIGNPASNPSYWTVTGAYNGQILNLQNQIDAINAVLPTLQGSIDTLDEVVDFIGKYSNKKICIYGDSLSARAFGNDDWTVPFNTLMTALGSTVTNHAVAGGDMTDANTYALADTNTYDFVLIWVGINDANNGTPLGAFDAAGTFAKLYHELIVKIKANSPNAIIFDFGLAYTNHNSLLTDPIKSWVYYNQSLEGVSWLDGVIFKSMMNLPQNSLDYNTATVDGLHFTPAYSQDVIYHKIIRDISNYDFLANEKLNIRFKVNTITFTESSSISVVEFSPYYAGSRVNVHCVFNVTTTLTDEHIADFNVSALPDHTIYSFTNSELFGINSSGKITASRFLPVGRYVFDFEYVPRHELIFYLGN